MKALLNIGRLIFCFAAALSSIEMNAQVPGCIDPLATNYNSSATVNDGSCVYAVTSVTPYAINILSDTIMETSGLIWYNNNVWTHNDNTDLNLYALDTTSGQIINKVSVQNATNVDWEEITQDSLYVYVGDFGNNANGNRTDLHILRIAKADLANGVVTPDTIRFSYSNQTSFSGTGVNSTDFDCEAFMATNDSLYLFTKQWVSGKTSLYSLSKTPTVSVQTAQLLYTHDVQGLITGATFIKSKKAIVLTGYTTNSTTFLNPFVFLLYDFAGNSFFSGNKRKINILQPFSQVEGITTTDGKSFFISNEKLSNSIITIPPRLEKIDLGQYLSGYYQTLDANDILLEHELAVFPNPASHHITIKIESKGKATLAIRLYDAQGKLIAEQNENAARGNNSFNVATGSMVHGVYYLEVMAGQQTITKKIEIGN